MQLLRVAVQIPNQCAERSQLFFVTQDPKIERGGRGVVSAAAVPPRHGKKKASQT